MILTTQQLYERYSDFSNKAAKISRDMKSGRLIVSKRTLRNGCENGRNKTAIYLWSVILVV